MDCSGSPSYGPSTQNNLSSLWSFQNSDKHLNIPSLAKAAVKPMTTHFDQQQWVAVRLGQLASLIVPKPKKSLAGFFFFFPRIIRSLISLWRILPGACICFISPVCNTCLRFKLSKILSFASVFVEEIRHGSGKISSSRSLLFLQKFWF